MSAAPQPQPSERRSGAPPAIGREAIQRLLADDLQPAVVYQPIVDLQRSVIVGYEALSRFGGPPAAPPDQWFAAAAALGHSEVLEARVLATVLRARASLPANSFVSVNLTPAAIIAPGVIDQLDSHDDLSRIVIEITEHTAISDYEALREQLDRHRAKGAHLAVDDAGAGYASLSHILELRPDFVKLDRSLIEDVGNDAAKLALIEMFGAFASRIDAWVLAEGIEQVEELDALIDLGVPLGQGYLLGRPAPAWSELDAGAADHIRRQVETGREVDQVGRLIERWTGVPPDASSDQIAAAFAGAPGRVFLPVINHWDRPVGLIARGDVRGDELKVRRPLIVKPSTAVHEAAHRAMTRAANHRFEPLLCCDERGHYLGVIPIERLVQRLAAERLDRAA